MSFSNILDRLNIPNMTRQGLTVSIGGASGSQQNPNQPELKDMHPLDPGTTKRRNPNYDWKKACERFYHKPSPHDLLEKCIACIEEEIRELTDMALRELESSSMKPDALDALRELALFVAYRSY